MRRSRLRGFARIASEIQSIGRNLRRTRPIERKELDPIRRRRESLERLLDERLKQLVRRYGVKDMNSEHQKALQQRFNNLIAPALKFAYENDLEYMVFTSPKISEEDHKDCTLGNCKHRDQAGEMSAAVFTNGKTTAFNVARHLLDTYGVKLILDVLRVASKAAVEYTQKHEGMPPVVPEKQTKDVIVPANKEVH